MRGTGRPMLYFRVTYDYEYGDEEAYNHPIIEIVRDPIDPKDLAAIQTEIFGIMRPDFLEKCKVRFLKK